jgi:hypothetical protein
MNENFRDILEEKPDTSLCDSCSRMNKTPDQNFEFSGSMHLQFDTDWNLIPTCSANGSTSSEVVVVITGEKALSILINELKEKKISSYYIQYRC